MPKIVYETMFILDANRYARDPNGVSAQIPQMIEKFEGEVLVSRLWNEQRLAFPIKGQHKGTYWLTYFRMESTSLSQFNRACQLNENVLRHQTLKVDPRLVETLVAHAQGVTDAKPDETAEEPAEGEEESKAEVDDAEVMAARE